MSINGRVDAEGEQVLVVRSSNTTADVGGPRHALTVLVVDGSGAENTSSADLELNTSGLVKNPSKDVLVVGDGADHLDNELAVTDNGGDIVAVVGVLVEDAAILLMEANDVLQLDSATLGVSPVSVEVLNVAQAVAAEAQLVGSDTEADITNIESLLAVVGHTGIAVWHSHLREGETVEHITVVIGNIIQAQTIAVVEADVELPLLPSNLVAVASNVERCTFGLLDDVGLEVGSERLFVQLMRVLNSLHGLPGLRFGRAVITTKSKVVNADELVGHSIENRRERGRQRVVVGLGVLVGHNVHVALEESATLVDVVGAVGPGIVADGNTLGELELLDLLDDLWVSQADFLHLDHLIDVDGALDAGGQLLQHEGGLEI